MTKSDGSGRRYGGKTVAERRAERRQRLLDAGLELFGTHGYAGTTIEMLCAAARLNPRYFYEEFDTREELLGAVYDRHIESVTATVVESVAAAPHEPRARLELGLCAFLAAVLADERAARINYFEMVGVSQALERKRREILHAYADLIASEIATIAATGGLSVADPRLVAVALVGAVDGLIIDHLSARRLDGAGTQMGGEPSSSEDRAAILATILGIVDPVLRDRSAPRRPA